MKTNILLSAIVSSALMAGTHLSAAEANGGETIKPAVESPAQRDAPNTRMPVPPPSPCRISVTKHRPAKKRTPRKSTKPSTTPIRRMTICCE